MKPILKWPGGKGRELPIIRRNIPQYSGRYVEPFVGGGAVYFDTENPRCHINDKSSELINFYNCVKQGNEAFARCLQLRASEFVWISTFVDEHRDEVLDLYQGRLPVSNFITRYNTAFSTIATEDNQAFIDYLKRSLKDKISRSYKLESKHGNFSDEDKIMSIETAIKAAYYMYIRFRHNSSGVNAEERAVNFFFLREYCYSSAFKYNLKGEFNVPYGGRSYNRKNLQKKVDYILSKRVKEKLSSTEISDLDFEEFLMGLDLTEDDFVFLDPPYDSAFSTYDLNAFGKKDQVRLYECLKHSKAKALLVIKNTDFIYGLYRKDFQIKSFDKQYSVSFKNRNERRVKHLVITNYDNTGRDEE